MEKGEQMFVHYWWDCKLMQPLWKAVSRTFKKPEMKLPYELVIPVLGVYPKDSSYFRDTCTSRFVAAFFTIAKKWKQLDQKSPKTT